MPFEVLPPAVPVVLDVRDADGEGVAVVVAQAAVVLRFREFGRSLEERRNFSCFWSVIWEETESIAVRQIEVSALNLSCS